MSWQAYVDTSLVGTGHVDKALICDVSGQTTWASSPGFSLTAAEMGAIASSFGDKSEPKSVLSNGVKANGDKFMTIEATDDTLIAKKGKEGLVAYKTTQAILIAHHDQDTQTPSAFNAVAELGLYLKGVGY
ncbi:Profilin/allergen [Dothidotthia symphoricarpi CBS 119687]|uniref:Profilin n=1 Tax=Dothidotthia symphoricarpi CBS 119687 TaxID=1392245 RepID=A0A6A6AQY7_9PLEO|nr:Profilin/allergen [Dothidotthia symphoricarpi CBS 119687]KAF2133588.1 Profilin/allergen [Dothidotthia symphoricarpi CBS 119687]